MRALVYAVAFSLVLNGCHAHVQLRAPEATASPEERMQAFARLRPTAMQQTAHYQISRYGAVSYAGTSTDYLQLADGTRVYHAGDILPVVAPDSPSARSAEESESAASTANTLSTLGWVGMIGGAVLMLVPIFSLTA